MCEPNTDQRVYHDMCQELSHDKLTVLLKVHECIVNLVVAQNYTSKVGYKENKFALLNGA